NCFRSRFVGTIKQMPSPQFLGFENWPHFREFVCNRPQWAIFATGKLRKPSAHVFIERYRLNPLPVLIKPGYTSRPSIEGNPNIDESFKVFVRLVTQKMSTLKPT